MHTPPHILIVEDEPKLAGLLRDYLQAEGYTTSHISDGAMVVPFVREHPPAMILLDLMLPHKSGLEICQEIRSFSSLPIIMITARVEEIDKLLGLELGADDYVCKPFSPREVVARVKAILRRVQPALYSATPSNDILINEDGFTAFMRGQDLSLTPAEFRLLRLFVRNPGKVFSRNQILEALYDDHRVVTDRTIDTHVKNLRRKLEQADCTQEYIVSVYSVGYKFEPSSAEKS